MKCRGYQPPEYIDRREISEKFDIFSLGVIMIRIVSGPESYPKCLDMHPDEFIDQVRNNILINRPFLIEYYIIFTSEKVLAKLDCWIYQVQNNWREKLQAASTSDSLLGAYCRQVETCTQIAMKCLENDSHKRPDIVKITEKLNEIETVTGKVINIICKGMQWVPWSRINFTASAIM
jgi:serine/threonine protein kinase